MMTIDEILNEVMAGGLAHVVLTGGEPMLFEPIVELSHRLKQLGKTITVETAGTIFRDLHCDLMSISPKLGHSTPVGDPQWERRHEELRLQPVVLGNLMSKYRYQLKFVVTGDPAEIIEIDSLLAQIGPVPPDHILLMPEGRDQASLWATAKKLVPTALERNWRLAPRLQIDLFGDNRGT